MKHTAPPFPAPRSSWDFQVALSEDKLRMCARKLTHARRDPLAMAGYALRIASWSAACCAVVSDDNPLEQAARSGGPLLARDAGRPQACCLRHRIGGPGRTGALLPRQRQRSDPRQAAVPGHGVLAVVHGAGKEAGMRQMVRLAGRTNKDAELLQPVFLALRSNDQAGCLRACAGRIGDRGSPRRHAAAACHG